MKAPRENARKWLVLLCLGVVSATGCFTRRPPQATFGHLWTFEPPNVPKVAAAALEPPSIIMMQPLEAPAQLVVVRGPAKPRVASTPATEPAKAEPEPEPSIAPEFTPQELEQAKAETQQNLDMMEKNLTLSSGRSLNATQQDLISKVRGFAETAREAMKTGDWVRARNLSKKAEVLSEELAASL